MAAGATQAPATATAISFLFIRISFVEVRQSLLSILSWEPLWGSCRPILGASPKFFLRSHPHDAKAIAFPQGVFRLSCNNGRPLLLARNGSSGLEKQPRKLLSGIACSHEGPSYKVSAHFRLCEPPYVPRLEDSALGNENSIAGHLADQCEGGFQAGFEGAQIAVVDPDERS